MSLPALTANDLLPFIARFYERLLADPVMAPFFAGIDLERHVPHIAGFWAMALFGEPGYRGDVMTPHLRLHERSPMGRLHFDRWLHHFDSTLDALHSGPKADEAKARARSIASVMLHRIGPA